MIDVKKIGPVVAAVLALITAVVALFKASDGDRVVVEPLVATTSSALSVGVPGGVYSLEANIRDEDCKSGLCDLSPAFARAMEDCNAHPPFDSDRAGCLFRIGPGKFRLSRTVKLCRQHTIEGAGGLGRGSRTMIVVDRGVTAFHVASAGECVGIGGAGGGEWSQILDLGVDGAGPKTSTAAHFGFLIHAKVELRGIYEKRFVQGVRIVADVKNVPPTNANYWRIWSSTFEANEHAGLFVAGGDASAGLASAISVASNCQKGEMWTPLLGEPGNVVDHAFLGNTFQAVHTATCRDATTKKVFRSFVFSNDSQRSLCLACYAESDQEPGFVSQGSMAIGGLASWSGTGLWMQGARIGGSVRIMNTQDPANITEVDLGNAAVPGSFVDFRAHAIASGAWPLRIKSEPAAKSFRVDVANSSESMPVRIIATKDASAPIGSLWFPKVPVFTGASCSPWSP